MEKQQPLEKKLIGRNFRSLMGLSLFEIYSFPIVVFLPNSCE
jgi:hypothetical protein